MSTLVSPFNGSSSGDASEVRAKVLELREMARLERDRHKVERDWDRSERAYRGQLYSDVDRVDWRSNRQNPKLWEVVQRFLPILTDQKPKFTMKARGPEDELLVSQLTFGIDYIWERQRMAKTLALWCKRAMKTGTSFLFPTVIDTGHGPECHTKLLNYRNVYPDPGATDDSDWQYCFIHLRLTLDQIRSFYGEAGTRMVHDEKIKPTSPQRETIGGYPMDRPQGPVYARAGSAANIGSNPYLEQLIVSPLTGATSDLRYNVWEFFLYDESEIAVDDETDDGETISLNIRRFTRPRHITLIEDHYSEELDRECAYAHGMIPVIRLACDDDDGEFWAGGLIAPLIDAVEEMSDLQNSISNASRLCAMPWWKVSTDSGIDANTIYGDAGMVLPFNPGSTVEMLAAPNLPNFLFEFWSRLNRQVDDASGITDVSRGQIGGLSEDTSGKAIQLAQEPTFTRMRLLLRNLESALSIWGFQTVANAIQYWPREYWTRILPPELAGQGLAFEGYTDDDLRTMPDIVMEAGSSLPQDKNQKWSQALALFNAGAFNPAQPEVARLELLKAAEWPDYANVVQRVSAAMPQMPPAIPGVGGPPPGPNKALEGGLSPEAAIAVRSNPNGQEV